MIQTVLMLAAALNLIAVACFTTAHSFLHIMLLQFVPVVLALSLGLFGFARIMGWPV